jgi:hypothetical protein
MFCVAPSSLLGVVADYPVAGVCDTLPPQKVSPPGQGLYPRHHPPGPDFDFGGIGLAVSRGVLLG